MSNNVPVQPQDMVKNVIHLLDEAERMQEVWKAAVSDHYDAADQLITQFLPVVMQLASEAYVGLKDSDGKVKLPHDKYVEHDGIHYLWYDYDDPEEEVEGEVTMIEFIATWDNIYAKL